MKQVITGLDRVAAGETKLFRGSRVGLVAHPASVDRRLRHAGQIFSANRGWKLTAMFGPQHGWFGEAQDNMIEAVDPPRVYSIYGKIREPTREMLDGVDIMVVDLQDVGTRVYTFIQTLYLVMRACARFGKRVIVLDRPNPIGGAVEGPMLDIRYASFVGLTEIPLRHGMTMGALAKRYQREFQSDLDVIGMKGWTDHLYFDETDLPWVMPSPNMPTLETAIVYPGMVLFEGTNASEGRGTTKPFEFVGSPGISAEKLAGELESYRLPGARFRPINFQPTFNKHAGKICGGVQVHVTDRKKFQAVLTGAAVLKAFRRLDKTFRWKKPPYEYEYKKYPIDILAGGDRLRTWIDRDVSLPRFQEWFEADAKKFRAKRRAEESSA